MAQSPWGKRPTGNGGNQRPPSGGNKPPEMDIDALLRKTHARMRGMMGSDGGASEKRIAAIIIAGLAFLWLISGVYRVNPDELGVVMRFGEYQRKENPGLNFHLPYPIETVLIPSVTSVNKVEIGGGGQAENPTVRSRAAFAEATSPLDRESLMLTSDRNIVDIGFEVQWKIDGTNPQDFLFNVRDPAGSVKAVAESAMREVIGRNKLEDVLTTAQSQIAEDTKAIMQRIFDQYKAGIEVIAVNLSKPDVPAPVIGEFQDVKRAEQDKETAESVAEGYSNDILPRAKGEAVQMVQEAEAYKNRIVAEAEGDVARFTKVYEQYITAKDVTRKRIYLETMEAVMTGMSKVIIDDSGKGQSVVPVLPLPAVSQPKASE